MHDDFYIDLFTEDEDTFDLEKDYEFYLEMKYGKKYKLKQSRKAGFDTDSTEYKDATELSDHTYGNAVGHGWLVPEGVEKNKNKIKRKAIGKLSKAELKYELAHKPGNKYTPEQIDKIDKKYNKLKDDYQNAADHNDYRTGIRLDNIHDLKEKIKAKSIVDKNSTKKERKQQRKTLNKLYKKLEDERMHFDKHLGKGNAETKYQNGHEKIREKQGKSNDVNVNSNAS